MPKFIKVVCAGGNKGNFTAVINTAFITCIQFNDRNGCIELWTSDAELSYEIPGFGSLDQFCAAYGLEVTG